MALILVTSRADQGQNTNCQVKAITIAMTAHKITAMRLIIVNVKIRDAAVIQAG